jgi:hypothetical protein
MATAHYGFPGTGYGYWMWTVYMSNNSPILNYVPLPGFVYLYRSETFSGMFGVPFASAKWTPSKDWTLGISIFGLNVNSEVAFGSVDTWQLFTAFNWNRHSFILTERAKKNDRLTIEEKKIGLGLRTPLFDMLDSELQAGYVFDRSAYIGQGVSNKDRGLARMNSDSYVSVSLRAGF